ncbi:GFA family protein [Chitinimonas viridis]|uniref:GFA family protein n=1 Tax=Chitinimonas viridis TaxID=664880 RepID=A0ABT8B6C3_9NEIS|nr:GFA family protein [Chitinimonas viridis]
MELELPDGVENPRRCNCSICSRRGAVTSSVPIDRLHIVRGGEFLTLYEFNSRVAKHYFCRVCGIYTHHRRRSDPSVFGYNVACLEGVDVFALGELPTSDGKNHICDRGGPNAV